VHLGTRKALIAGMTVLIYTVSACAFIAPSHCCSQHSHGDGDEHGDHDHVISESASDAPVLSGLTSRSTEPSFSQRRCCGQGFHGKGDGIALHAANCQRPTEPNRLVTWLSPSAAPDHGGPVRLNYHSLSICALSRAPARSPALESILTVSLLI
jgi:hypothetical protein